jgi:predicted nucleotidyltransferase
MYMRKVNASELRTELFSLLDAVERGEAINVVRNGRVVATLKPPASEEKPEIDKKAIARCCRRHGATELALFGSVLRDDFGPGSDVDVMVDVPGDRSLFDLVDMQEELEKILGRDVDLVTKRAVLEGRNEIRKRSILEGAKVIYVDAR